MVIIPKYPGREETASFARGPARENHFAIDMNIYSIVSVTRSDAASRIHPIDMTVDIYIGRRRRLRLSLPMSKRFVYYTSATVFIQHSYLNYDLIDNALTRKSATFSGVAPYFNISNLTILRSSHFFLG